MGGPSRCNEIAKISLPWCGKIFNYCPLHALHLLLIANASGNPIQVLLLPETASVQCESKEILSIEEKELNKNFNP